MDYADLLKDKRWYGFRKQVFIKDGWKCTVCGSPHYLQAHHTFYNHGRKPWEYPLDSVKTLCNDCHEDVEFVVLAVRNDPFLARKLATIAVDELKLREHRESLFCKTGEM